MMIIDALSPNYSTRNGAAVDMLVLHYTGMQSGMDALLRMQDPTPGKRVSAHYMVEENGQIFRLVEEAHCAWHAGVSEWRGEGDINARSIGIEIVNPGHEFGYRPFPPEQMDAVLGLCQAIIARHGIEARHVVGHSDIAPVRKEDPGELFDWAYLAAQGVGLWPKAQANGVVAAKLAEYGYDIADLSAAIIAFQRHFRPEKLSGEWDAECASLLAGLLAMV